MDRWKAEMGRVREKRRIEERRSEKRKSQKKEDADARKGRKVAKQCVFQMICGSGGSKSRLAKAAGAEPSGQMRWKIARRCGTKHISKSKCTKHTILGPFLEVEMSKKCTPLWREAHFEVKMYKAHQVRTTFGSSDVEKEHAVVARSTFQSQNVKNTTCLDHFWKLRCRKSARRCGAKHISKWTCTKHTMFGPLLEVAMSKGCTPLRREAHFEVNMLETQGFGPLLEVQMSFCVAGARDGAPCQKWAKREGFVAFLTTTTTTPHYTPIHYTTTTTTPSLHSSTLHYTTLLHYTQLHSSTLHCTTLHYVPLHYTTLRYTTLHYTTLHYATLRSTTLHYISLHYIPLHYTTLHYTPLHYTTTTLHYTPLRCTPLHSTTLHSITLHYTTLHYTTER